jgi:hypothetical protein
VESGRILWYMKIDMDLLIDSLEGVGNYRKWQNVAFKSLNLGLTRRMFIVPNSINCIVLWSCIPSEKTEELRLLIGRLKIWLQLIKCADCLYKTWFETCWVEQSNKIQFKSYEGDGLWDWLCRCCC